MYFIKNIVFIKMLLIYVFLHNINSKKPNHFRSEINISVEQYEYS